jgi:hypothetical protein
MNGGMGVQGGRGRDKIGGGRGRDKIGGCLARQSVKGARVPQTSCRGGSVWIGGRDPVPRFAAVARLMLVRAPRPRKRSRTQGDRIGGSGRPDGWCSVSSDLMGRVAPPKADTRVRRGGFPDVDPASTARTSRACPWHPVPWVPLAACPPVPRHRPTRTSRACPWHQALKLISRISPRSSHASIEH